MEWSVIVIPMAILVFGLAAGVHIAVSLGVAGFVGYWLAQGPGPALDLIGLTLYGMMNNFVFSAVPLFILLAEILEVSEAGSKLFDAGNKWLGRLPGGLAVATVAVGAVFAALCGVSVAAAATIGLVAIPEMRRLGYDKKLSTGVVAASGTLSILIPPSVLFILYGLVAEESIGRLFIAGVIPGIILTAAYIVGVLVMVMRNPSLAPPGGTFSWKEKMVSLKGIWAMLVLIVVVLGSIYAGVCSPTEAAGVGAFSALLISVITRKLTLANLKTALSKTVLTTSMVLIIATMALYFARFLTVTGATQRVVQSIVSLPVSPWVVMIAVNVLMLILGCFLDSPSIVLITMPILVPIIKTLGFDPIWFGVVVCINMEIALLTPPVGMNCYVISGIVPDIPLADIFQGIIPFVIMDAIVLAIIIALPQLSLWLPSLMMG